jgi:hypothetical protein
MISCTAARLQSAQAQMRTRPGTTSFVVGSLAIGLIVAGGLVLVQQLLHWSREREWVTVTLRSMIRDNLGMTPVPSMLVWLQRMQSDVHGVVVQMLDAVPLWMFLVLVGGVMAVRVGRVES